MVYTATKYLIEQHFHGVFGVNFNTCDVSDVLFVAKKIKTYGIGGIFPTLVTDTIDNIKKQTEIIKQAAKNQTSDMAKILGIHLEGIFLNPLKKGIHDESLFLIPDIKNYKRIEDDFIKIVTLAPEFCTNIHEGMDLTDYLREKDIKVQAGHCVGDNLSKCTGATHLFNAMSPVVHRGGSTALSALIEDSLYTEIIADGVHLSDDILKLIFKSKPINKILLISDCLPCTGLMKQECSSFDFCGKKIFYDGTSATSSGGTLAGSTKLVSDMIKILFEKNIISKQNELEQIINNPYEYHNIDNIEGEIFWNENWQIISK